MEVIHYFLIFLVINLGLLYWFQQSVLSEHPSTAPTTDPAKNKFANQKDLPANWQGRLDDVRSCQGGAFVNNKCRLAGLAGPATGFHQSFKPSVDRELGWRSYFIRKFGGLGTSQKAANDDGLQGTLTQNYLANLPSTDNIYRQTDY
jgi:hypothetical protein